MSIFQVEFYCCHSVNTFASDEKRLKKRKMNTGMN